MFLLLKSKAKNFTYRATTCKSYIYCTVAYVRVLTLHCLSLRFAIWFIFYFATT